MDDVLLDHLCYIDSNGWRSNIGSSGVQWNGQDIPSLTVQKDGSPVDHQYYVSLDSTNGQHLISH